MLMALWGLGCATGSRETQPAPTAEPVMQQPVQAVQPEAAKTKPEPVVPTSYSVSVATFAKDHLDECIDLVIEARAGSESKAQERIEHWKKDPATQALSKTTLSRPCAEQFTDRVVLATCVIDRPGDLGRVLMTDRYYDIRSVGNSDANMKDCLERHGDWRPNANTNAVEHARIRRDIADVQRLIDESPQ